MKRFFTIAVAVALAACIGTHAWSQGGQSGGGGTSGAAGASGSTGTSGTAGTAGTSATTGAAGTTGTSGAAGTAGTSGAAGATGNVGVGVGQTQAGANVSGQVDASAQLNTNLSGMSQSPFFADPRVRQELRLTDQQFNALNRAHQNALRSLNQNQTVTGQGTATAAAQRARNLQEFQARQNTDVAGTAGTDIAAQQRAARLQEFQNRFNLDLNQTVDTTITDPALRQRFNQLNLQFQGLSAFNDPTIQRQLNLTNDQRRQLMRLNTEFRRDLNQLLRTARTDPTLEQQVLDLRTRFMTQVNVVLTPEQQQLWAQLTGQPFQFSGQVFLPTTNATGSVQVGAQQPAAGQSGTSRAPQTRRRVR